MKSVCSKCNGLTNQEVLAEKKYGVDEPEGRWWESYKYQIIQCKGCEQISYRTLYNDIQLESYAQDEDGSYHDSSQQELYPKRTINTITIKNLLNTPLNIKKIYRETIDAFNNEQTILCSAGLRAIVEGICINKGITCGEVTDKKTKKNKISKNLDGKIEGLASKGFLTSSNARVLHDLRFLGNEAIHSLSAPSVEELKLAIQIIEHSLENIYELQHQALKLRAAKANRGGAK